MTAQTVPFGEIREIRFEASLGLGAVRGQLLLYPNPAGEWVSRLLLALQERDRLDLISVAVDLDLRTKRATVGGKPVECVTKIERCHGLYLAHRSAAGGAFLPKTTGETTAPRRGDVDLVVGLIGPPPEGVRFLTDPPAERRLNADGTLRVMTVLQLDPEAHKRARLGRFAEIMSRSGEVGAVIGGEALDRADALARVNRNLPPIDPAEAEAQGRANFDAGIAQENFRAVAVRRLAGRARLVNERLPVTAIDEARTVALTVSLDEQLIAEQRRARVDVELRRLLREYRNQPARRAALEYILGQMEVLSRRSRAFVAREHQTTVKAIRRQEDAGRRELRARIA